MINASKEWKDIFKVESKVQSVRKVLAVVFKKIEIIDISLQLLN